MPTFRLGVLATLALFLSTGTATAQVSKFWDTTAGLGNGVGGSGTWGTTFSNAATGDAALSTAATIDNLFFQGTAGTITLSANVTGGSLTFNTTGYVITGNSTTARTVTGAISLASGVNLTIGNGEATAIAIGLGSVSGGAGSTLTINGAATGAVLTQLNLSTGTTPTVNVPIIVTGTGFAAIASGTTGAQVTGTVTGNGQRLNLGAASGTTAIAFTQAINNGTGTVRIASGVSGGTGIVLLSGIGNTWGTTELNNASTGILRMGVTNALPTATTLTFGAATGNGNSIVELSGFNTTIGQLTNGAQSGGTIRNTSATPATLTISGSDTSAAAYSGIFQDGVGGGALSLVRSGTGTTTLAGTGTTNYTGGTTISGGTIKLGAANRLPTATTTTVTLGEAGGPGIGTLDLNGFAQQIGGLNTATGTNVTASQNTITSSTAATLTVAGPGTFGGGTTTNSGVLTGALSLSVSGGTGTLILGDTNTYTGTVTIGANRTLQVGTGGTTGTLGGTGNVTNNGSLFFNRSDVVTFNRIIANGGSLRQAGSGTLVLTAANTYSGGTTVNVGGTLQVGDGVTGSINGLGSINNNGTLVFNSPSAINIFGLVAGSGTFRQSGAGAVTLLSGTNTLTGPWIIDAGRTLNVGDGGTGDLDQTSTKALGFGPVTNNGTLAFNLLDNTLGGAFYNAPNVISGPGALTITGLNGSQMSLTGNNNITGTTTVNGAVLQIGTGSNLTSGALGTGDLVNNLQLVINRDTYVMPNNISGTGEVILLGNLNSVISFNGVNTYTGNTTVSFGTLGGRGSIGAGTVTVASGAGIRGGVADGTNNAGALSFGGTQIALNDGAFVRFEVNRTAPNTATASRLNLTAGTLNLSSNAADGVLNIELLRDNSNPNQFQAFETYTVTLAHAAGTGNIRRNGVSLPTGVVLSSAYDVTSNGIGVINTTLAVVNASGGQDLVLTFTPTPEPGTVLGIAVGAMALGGFVRRKVRDCKARG